MARKYSLRNERYKGLTARIHAFIIAMMKVHKEELEERRKRANPLNDPRLLKLKVAKRLEYAKDSDESLLIRFTKLPQHLAKESERRRKLAEVRNFLTHIHWKACEGEEQKDAEGITWIELFILFNRRGGRMQEEADTLRNKNMLQKDMAEFKRHARDVFCHTCPPEHEWRIKPSYTRVNRLRDLTISNKHASIKGIPRINE